METHENLNNVILKTHLNRQIVFVSPKYQVVQLNFVFDRLYLQSGPFSCTILLEKHNLFLQITLLSTKYQIAQLR